MHASKQQVDNVYFAHEITIGKNNHVLEVKRKVHLERTAYSKMRQDFLSKLSLER